MAVFVGQFKAPGEAEDNLHHCKESNGLPVAKAAPHRPGMVKDDFKNILYELSAGAEDWVQSKLELMLIADHFREQKPVAEGVISLRS